MKEQWKNLKFKGYEVYEVSSLGKVKRDGKLLKCRKDKDGYLRVNLCVKNIRRTMKVHTAVAVTFIDNPNNFKTVNHKDGNKLNNCVENLEWLTSQENYQHARENELFSFYRAVDAFNEKTKEKVGHFISIRELCKKLKLINRTEVTIAIKNGFSYRGYSFKECSEKSLCYV